MMFPKKIPGNTVISQSAFESILEKTIGVWGIQRPRNLKIYRQFKHSLLSAGMELDEQVLFLSHCIDESEGFRSKEEEDPTRNPGESDDEYLERLKYKGRGYLRLVGKDVYRAACRDLVWKFGDVLKNPNIVSYSIKSSVEFSIWLWGKFVAEVYEQYQYSNKINKMRASMKALYRDWTEKQLVRRLDYYQTAEKVVKEAESKGELERYWKDANWKDVTYWTRAPDGRRVNLITESEEELKGDTTIFKGRKDRLRYESEEFEKKYWTRYDGLRRRDLTD